MTAPLACPFDGVALDAVGGCRRCGCRWRAAADDLEPVRRLRSRLAPEVAGARDAPRRALACPACAAPARAVAAGEAAGLDVPLSFLRGLAVPARDARHAVTAGAPAPARGRGRELFTRGARRHGQGDRRRDGGDRARSGAAAGARPARQARPARRHAHPPRAGPARHAGRWRWRLSRCSSRSFAARGSMPPSRVSATVRTTAACGQR